MFGFRGSGAKLCSERPGETLRGAADLTEKSPYKFERDYTLEQKLRSGSYGVVHTTRHKKTGEEYAVKVIDRKKLKEKDDKATFGEIAIMKDLTDVDHIVRLIDVYIVPECFYIVQVYAQGGDVFDRLAKRVSYTEKDGRDLSVMLLSTMKQLHERRVCHRDLKPENLLLQGTDDDCNILLADFGFAKYVPEDGLKTRCGTPAFVAPEIIVGARYSTQADNWSVGCLIYMLLGGYPPFQDETHRGLFRKVRAADFTFHDKYWSNVSLSAKQLITNLLTVDPEDRFDASEALGSSWLKIQPERLSTRDLSGSISEFQSFNARRTLKSAINTVVWSVGHAFQVDKINDLLQETDKDDEDETLGVGALALGGVPHKLNMSLKKKKRCEEVYEIGDKIHSGSMAVVKVCRHRENNKKYAVKIIKRSSKTDEAVLQEVAIMNQMHHPNLVSVVDFFEEDDFHYMIMELMEGGDVFDRIIGLQSYTEKDARDLAKILLEAVYYMHKNGIAHRDIKPQNIFLESKDSHSAIKIGDFGFAKKVHTPKSLTSRCGTPSYVAPEILKNQPYDQSCDMWSVGVVLYVMLCGYTPFSDENQERMFERIKLGEWKFEASDWLHVSSEAKDLIEQCICTNVDKRITAAQALKSRWIAGLTDQQLSSNDLSFTSQTIKKAPKLSDIAKSFMALRSGANKAKGGLSAIASSALYSVSTAGSATASRPEKSEYTTTTSSARHVV